MRWWVFAIACAACNGAGGSDGIGGVYNVALDAGSNQCDALYAPFFHTGRTIAITATDVSVTGSAGTVDGPDGSATDVMRDGSDISFSIEWQVGTGGENGRVTGDETYELTGDATQLSGSASGVFEIAASPPCSLAFAVTTTSLGSGH